MIRVVVGDEQDIAEVGLRPGAGWDKSEEIDALVCCGIGFGGGQCPSLADCVRGRGGHAGGDRRRSVLRLPTLLERVK